MPAARTPLYDLHVSLGARMVPFAGYDMPVQYPAGIIAEHGWTRQSAGLFDVSHMGQAILKGPDHATTAAALERLVPGDIAGLKPGQIRYTQLLNPLGGIIDDLMVTRPAGQDGGGTLGLVVNASRKEEDYTWLEGHLPPSVKLVRRDDHALVALQGPMAEAVIARYAPEAASLPFMHSIDAAAAGLHCTIARSGYTGEDGFEISTAAENVRTLTELLLAEPEVKPVGLGARDSLRLEAGLCLYGHDIDGTTSPVEAGLVWSIGKARRTAGGFIGAERVLREITAGPPRKRVGLKPQGRAPARDGTLILTPGGEAIGAITSGSFGPTVAGPIAMGYVAASHAAPGTAVTLMVRDRPLAASVAALPFVPHSYKR